MKALFVSYLVNSNGHGNAVIDGFREIKKYEDIRELEELIRKKYKIKDATIINWRRME